MTADELVALVKRSNARKIKLEKEALAIAHAVVEKALAPAPPSADNEEEAVKDGTRDILLRKYHANRKPKH